MDVVKSFRRQKWTIAFTEHHARDGGWSRDFISAWVRSSDADQLGARKAVSGPHSAIQSVLMARAKINVQIVRENTETLPLGCAINIPLRDVVWSILR